MRQVRILLPATQGVSSISINQHNKPACLAGFSYIQFLFHHIFYRVFHFFREISI